MYIEPTITRVPSGFSGYIWFNTKIVFKKHIHPTHMGFHMHFLFLKSEVGAEIEGPPILILPRAAKCLRPALQQGVNLNDRINA